MTTLTRNPLADLTGLWKKELRSFLDYLVEWSDPVAIDDQDRHVLAAFAEFHAAEQPLKDRVLDLFRRFGVRPDPPAWPMSASTYNFMRPRALADVFLRTARQDVRELQALREGYEGAEGLEERLIRYLVDDTIKVREEAMARIEKILGIEAGAKPKAAEAAKPAAVAEEAPAAAPEKTGPAWHDEALSLEERMDLVKGMGVFEKLFAAMAQTDCTACGYDCEGYAKAIAEGEDKDISKCAPGGEETRKMLVKILAK